MAIFKKRFVDNIKDDIELFDFHWKKYLNYLEKLESGNRKPDTAAGGQGAAQTNDSAKPAPKGKDARKARAQQREAEKALKRIEAKIEKLTEEQTALTDEMMSRRDADFAAINARLAKIQTEIQSLETQWETTAEALEG